MPLNEGYSGAWKRGIHDPPGHAAGKRGAAAPRLRRPDRAAPLARAWSASPARLDDPTLAPALHDRHLALRGRDPGGRRRGHRASHRRGVAGRTHRALRRAPAPAPTVAAALDLALRQRHNTGQRFVLSRRGPDVWLQRHVAASVQRGRAQEREMATVMAIRLLRHAAGASWRPNGDPLRGAPAGPRRGARRPRDARRALRGRADGARVPGPPAGPSDAPAGRGGRSRGRSLRPSRRRTSSGRCARRCRGCSRWASSRSGPRRRPRA